MFNERAMRTAPTKRPEKILVRKPQWTFKELVGQKPRSEFGRLLFGAMSLVFPEGERFFIRSVKQFASQIDDAALGQDIKDFIGQEAQHGKVHETFNKAVLGHDYDIEPFLKWYKSTMFDFVEQKATEILGPKLALSITAAAEHFTATWAAHGLSSGYLEEHITNQNMLDFMQWHAVEEIEHKHVAFDVLQQIDDSYALRAAGMLFCAALLPFVISVAFVSLVRQAKNTDIFAFFRDALSEGANGGIASSFLPAIVEYLKPGFHPSDHDDYEMARRVAQGIEQRMEKVA
ncbi:MAG TPA: metal-dependent hydrolase [Turneriella sp.]|nr:metal-dependent hydrolase [Turneriella sp.]HNE20423.1 metal-dependent hydrolase [Turneriella sp.]HNJ66141.1 metal-dependent hydrolase [Turneriella sp.]HNL55749.1 metal-dependent hydrolase [Turneriella sp.]